MRRTQEPILALAHSPDPRADALAPSGLTELVALARRRSSDDRERLLLGVAALCRAAPRGKRTTALLGEIFVTLAIQAERDIRRALAEQLADADWAPKALINMLALDEIEIARPIIAASPILDDADLLRILVEATLEHQIAVAGRPRLSGRVADAIIDRGDSAVMTALAANSTAEVGDEALRRLVEHSRRVTSLRAPLVRHPALSAALAGHMRQWVGGALREAIVARFQVDAPSLSVAIDQALRDTATSRPPEWSPMSTPDGGPDDAERHEMERRLVDKLNAAGQLKPGFLIRALRERRLGLFEQALAALGGFPLAQVRAAVRADTPEALSLACAAVGVDRAVFADVLAEVRRITAGRPGGDPLPYVPTTDPDSAALAFRALWPASTV